MDNRSPNMLKATLIGGGVAGAAAGLPIVGALNCACCSLIIAGGFLAAFLYSRDCVQAGVPFQAGNGATVGLVAGLFYAVSTTVVGAIVQLIIPFDLGQTLDALEEAGIEIPPEVLDQVESLAGEGGFSLGFVVLGFFFSLILGAIFSTVGGLIGGAVFKRQPAPPAAPGGTPFGGGGVPPAGGPGPSGPPSGGQA